MLQQDSWFTEEELHSVEPPPFLIDGVIPMRSINMLFGEYNIGKTFLIMDMAAHVAIGKPWEGKPTEMGDILYIASEGDPGNLGVRMKAWREHNGVDFPVPMIFYADVVSLRSEAQNLIDEAVARGLRPRLVVVDTLAMALDDNENDNQVMNDLIKALRSCQTYEVDGEEFELAWLLVHHTGWEKGRPRGGSAMPGGLDYIMGVEGVTENTVKLFHHKAKNSAKFAPMHFEQVEVGDSIVYKRMSDEEAKVVNAGGKDTNRAAMQADFEQWTYIDGAMEGHLFSQADFRRAFEYTDKDKSNVSNMFKAYESTGLIEKVGQKYKKAGIVPA